MREVYVKRIVLVIVVFVLLAALVAISISPNENKTALPNEMVKVEKIVRIFMVSEGTFIMMVETSPREYALKRISSKKAGVEVGSVKFVSDITKGDYMWAEQDVESKNLTIHISDVSVVNSSGWNNGKFGSGFTTPM